MEMIQNRNKDTICVNVSVTKFSIHRIYILKCVMLNLKEDKNKRSCHKNVSQGCNKVRRPERKKITKPKTRKKFI